MWTGAATEGVSEVTEGASDTVVEVSAMVEEGVSALVVDMALAEELVEVDMVEEDTEEVEGDMGVEVEWCTAEVVVVGLGPL